MTSRSVFAHVALAALVLSIVPAVGCGGGDSGPVASGKTNPKPSGGGDDEGTTTDTTPNDPTPGSSSGKPADPLPPAPESACKLPELTAQVVSPTFTVYEPPGTVPPEAKGGKIDGKYIVEKATVYLPTSTKNLVRPAQSTGTVTGWAIFDGKNFRVSLKGDLQVQTIVGKQAQTIDVVDQGTFAATNATVRFETSCNGGTAQQADVQFSENGAKGTLIIKQPVEGRGDAYFVLEASRGQ